MTTQPAFEPYDDRAHEADALGPFTSGEARARRLGTVTPLRRHTGVTSVQGSLALDLEPLLDPPAVHLLPGGLRADVVAVSEARRAGVGAFVGRYLQVAVEIAVGDRPATQLLRHTDAAVFEDLRRRGVLVGRVAGSTGSGRRGPDVVRPVLRGVRTSFVRPDAVEASAHVAYGARSRALAGRFEITQERWQCVALEFA